MARVRCSRPTLHGQDATDRIRWARDLARGHQNRRVVGHREGWRLHGASVRYRRQRESGFRGRERLAGVWQFGREEDPHGEKIPTGRSLFIPTSLLFGTLARLRRGFGEQAPRQAGGRGGPPGRPRMSDRRAQRSRPTQSPILQSGWSNPLPKTFALVKLTQLRAAPHRAVISPQGGRSESNTTIRLGAGEISAPSCNF